MLKDDGGNRDPLDILETTSTYARKFDKAMPKNGGILFMDNIEAIADRALPVVTQLGQ